MRLWDVIGGRELAVAVVSADTRRLDIDPDDESLLRDVAYSRDGTLLAVAAGDGRIRVWRVSGGALREIATLQGHTAAVNDLSFSPDGRTLATASDDHTVKLWDTALFRELMTIAERKGRTDVPRALAGSENQVRAAALSSNGEVLVTGLADGTVRFRRASVPAARPLRRSISP